MGLTDLVTHLKKMPRMHMHKCSRDMACAKLYKYMRERDKSMKSIVQKPINALETAECNTYLDSVTLET